MWKAILRAIAVAGFRAIMRKASEEVRKALAEQFRDTVQPFLSDLKVQAEETPNPWDDIGVEALQGIVNAVEITPPE